VDGDGGFVSFDNTRSVESKGQFVKHKGLRGLFFWTGTGDKQMDSDSLIGTGWRVLHS